MGSMISYTTAAMERAMKVQEVILRALAGGPLKPSFGLSGAVPQADGLLVRRSILAQIFSKLIDFVLRCPGDAVNDDPNCVVHLNAAVAIVFVKDI